MTYTKKQCKEDMILLWGELARSGGDNKLEAARDVGKDFYICVMITDCNCPCCEYDYRKRKESKAPDCSFCPAGGRGKNDYCLDGVYEEWCLAETPNERRYYANKILIKALMIREDEE